MAERLIPRPNTEALLDEITELIDDINTFVVRAQKDLSAVQPVRIGTIILYLNYHSQRKPTCFGCPHLDWRKTNMIGDKPHQKLSMTVIKGNPVKAVNTKGELAVVQHDVRELISNILKQTKDKSEYTAELGHLSRLISARKKTPELKQRLNVRERGRILKELIIERMHEIDSMLDSYSATIKRMQANDARIYAELKFESCGKSCDFCRHPKWYVQKKVPGSNGRYTREEKESPLPSLPRNTDDPEQMEDLREVIGRARDLIDERKKFQSRITLLSRKFSGRFQVVEND
jgi:hypothetical protein